MTLPHDPRLASYAELCQPARRLALFTDETIATITPHTTSAQIHAAKVVIASFYEHLKGQLHFTHHADYPGHGIHTCVREVFIAAVAKCNVLAELQPEPKPEPPPKQQLITLSGVVIDLEEEYRASWEETDLGTEDDPPDRRSTR